MSQITRVESRGPLLQLVVENRDVDRDFYILSILAAFAREEMETQSGEESKRCFAEKERKSVGDVREHNRLVEILEEIGVPVAYMEYNGSPVKTTKRKNIVNHSVSGHRIDFAADGRA